MALDRMLALQVTPPEFPWLGNSVPVGIVFLLHVAVAEFSVGAITLAVDHGVARARDRRPPTVAVRATRR